MLFYNLLMLNAMFIFTPMSSSFDSTVRLYDSFTEIHPEYNESFRSQQTNWVNIKHESIILRSSSENGTNMFERRVVRMNMNKTGKRIG